MKSYKIKKSDSAATVPGRVTFPQGSYTEPPPPRLPYAMRSGTQASGVSGYQGASAAMYPTQKPPTFNWNGNQYANMLQQGSQYGPLGTAYAAGGIATDFAGEVLNTTGQAFNYGANQVNQAVDQAVNAYKGSYANVPDSLIQSLAVFNPGMALGLLNSRNAALGMQIGGGNAMRPNTQNAPATSVNLGYNPAMRGRGFQLGYNPNGFTPQSIGVGNTGPGPGSYILSEYGPDTSYLTPSQLAQIKGGNASVFDPTQTYGGFTNTGGSGNTDYANTAAAQYYAANGTPFTQQKRWDPQAKKYVSIGRLMKQGKLDASGRWHKTSNRQRATRNQNQLRSRQQQQQPAQLDNSTASAFVSFRA